MKRLVAEVTVPDLAFLLGFGVLIWGVARLSVTAALIVAGVLICAAAASASRSE